MKKPAVILLAAALLTVTAAAHADDNPAVTYEMPETGPESPDQQMPEKPTDQRPSDTPGKTSGIGPAELPDQASQVAKDVTSAIQESLGSGVQNAGESLGSIISGLTPGGEDPDEAEGDTSPENETVQ